MKRSITGKKVFTVALLLLAFMAVLAAPTVVSAASQDGSRLNINTASVEQFTALPGLGTIKAQSIVDFRTEHGPFASVDDLILVSGIGNKLVNRVRELVTANSN
ncbi:MAG TPA: ComEA family DNA-binding protein [Proteobacteria bacterium]|nr:comE operon protein 1 [bacterium BMS3Abin14]HDL52958.1 ComEA family DNA-binding protein [Pseudomonadota bacterium]